jgi:hypothetical protein
MVAIIKIGTDRLHSGMDAHVAGLQCHPSLSHLAVSAPGAAHAAKERANIHACIYIFILLFTSTPIQHATLACNVVVNGTRPLNATQQSTVLVV